MSILLSQCVKHNASISTWDILRHYGAFSDEIVQNLDDLIESPENGITLSLSAHHTFDNYRWCFVPVEVQLQS
jgi:hypothetical protein